MPVIFCVLLTCIMALQYALGSVASSPDKPVLLNWSNWKSSLPSLLYFTSIFLYRLGIAMKLPPSSICFAFRLSCSLFCDAFPLSRSYETLGKTHENRPTKIQDHILRKIKKIGEGFKPKDCLINQNSTFYSYKINKYNNKLKLIRYKISHKSDW